MEVLGFICTSVGMRKREQGGFTEQSQDLSAMEDAVSHTDLSKPKLKVKNKQDINRETYSDLRYPSSIKEKEIFSIKQHLLSEDKFINGN